MEFSTFLVFMAIHFATGVLGEKRILVNDHDFTQQQIHNLQTTVQDLQSKLTAYQNDLLITKTDLSATKNDLSATKSQLAAQVLKVTLQENKLSQQETKITQQEQTILTMEQKLQYQEGNITNQENKVLSQQTMINSITSNLTSVMSHNFEDEMAQAMCSSNTDHSAYVYAIRRNCYSGHAPMCSDICTNAAATYHLGDKYHTLNECFDAFQIQKTHNHLAVNQPDEGKPFMYVFRYSTPGCSFKNVCGPNYCCCRA